MRAQPKSYGLRDCALFNIQSKRKLAERLLVDCKQMVLLAKGGTTNYKQFSKKGKDGHKDRWVEEPKAPLKLVQKRINHLLSFIAPPEYLFSSVKGQNRSAVTNAMRHKIGVALAQTDIKKFFPSASGHRVAYFFRNRLQCSEDVAAILTALTTIGPTDNSDHNHLPTGGVTSQVLSFLAYEEMFDEINICAVKRGTTFTLMVDDMNFSGEGAREGQINDVRIILKKYGLRSHPKKERFFSPGQTKITTGVANTNAGYRLPQGRRLNIHKSYAALNSAVSPTDRASAYERLAGMLRAAGQIETRFNSLADRIQTRWKADFEAWAAYRSTSQKRQIVGKRRRARKVRVLRDLRG